MASTARNRPTRAAFRSLRSRALFLGIVGASGLFAATAVTQAAASRPGVTPEGRQAVARTARLLSSSICSKVSPASVSALVGYSVPAGTPDIRKLKATKQNFGISAVVTTCTFGSQASMAALLKDVTLSSEVTSKPLTTSEMQQEVAKASGATFKFKFTPYSGLGVPAFYFSMTAAGISAEGIEGVDGTKSFGASVETKTLSKSKLAALAKLAEKL
jgi:hypothetical protein